jgi:hypothetical protein
MVYDDIIGRYFKLKLRLFLDRVLHSLKSSSYLSTKDYKLVLNFLFLHFSDII